MNIVFDKLIEFDQRVFRNIQGKPYVDEFDDLTKDPKAMSYAHRLSRSFKSTVDLNDLRYQAIDFIFDLKCWQPSRFGNGKFPIWYGSLNLQTSFQETLYHWWKTFLVAPENFQEDSAKPIKTLRTVFTVNCQATLIDLSDKTDAHQELISPYQSDYPLTQRVGVRVQQEGFPGIITKSARLTEGENVVAFKKNILNKPKLFDEFLYEYNTKTSRVEVKQKDSLQLIYESMV